MVFNGKIQNKQKSRLKGFQECAMLMINTGEKNISKLQVIVLIYHMYKYNVPLRSLILKPERLSV